MWIIAVLPSQTSLADDPDLAALNEGLAFTLTAKLVQLSREHDLQVIPANLLREEGVDSLEKARRELGVTLALNFDTHRFDDRVRVNVQLVDVPRQRQLMAETIDGYMDDLLALEEKVTIRVLRLLRVELRPMEQDLLQAGTSEPRAHDYYLRGQGYLQSFLEAENVEPAVTLFEQALRVDPNYARAHAGLGEAFWRRYEMTGDQRWVESAFEECRTAVELDEAAELFARAAALDENDYFNVGNLADAYHWGGEGKEKARQTYLRAASICEEQLQVNSREPFILADRAYFLAMAGVGDQAVEEMEKALGVAPTDMTIQHRAAQVYHVLGQTETALPLLRSSVESGYPRSEIAADPLFADLKGNSEFAALVGESLP